MNDEYFDPEFYEYVTFEYPEGGTERRKVLKNQTSKLVSKGSFHEYDSSHGHCPLCGRIICRGNCFR